MWLLLLFGLSLEFVCFGMSDFGLHVLCWLLCVSVVEFRFDLRLLVYGR